MSVKFVCLSLTWGSIRICRVLRDYPPGTQSLRELVQNADDAGAEMIKFFLLGSRDLNVSDCLHEGLREFSGTALYAWNDAPFTESDFKAIRNIGKSSKKSDATKTGKFGLGFNAVYHFTDLPCFVTGKYLVIMDPHQQRLMGEDGERAFARRWDLLEPNMKKFKAHAQWFKVPGHSCSFGEEYEGTMFRFPLRTAAQAEYSYLSKETWSVDSISSIFDQFQLECEPMLLFLKSVTCHIMTAVLTTKATDFYPRDCQRRIYFFGPVLLRSFSVVCFCSFLKDKPVSTAKKGLLRYLRLEPWSFGRRMKMALDDESSGPN